MKEEKKEEKIEKKEKIENKIDVKNFKEKDIKAQKSLPKKEKHKKLGKEEPKEEIVVEDLEEETEPLKKA